MRSMRAQYMQYFLTKTGALLIRWSEGTLSQCSVVFLPARHLLGSLLLVLQKSLLGLDRACMC